MQKIVGVTRGLRRHFESILILNVPQLWPRFLWMVSSNSQPHLVGILWNHQSYREKTLTLTWIDNSIKCKSSILSLIKYSQQIMQKPYLTCIMKLSNAKYYTVVKWPKHWTTPLIKHVLLKYEKTPSKILFHDIATVYTMEKYWKRNILNSRN